MGFLADILGGTADEFYSALPSQIRNLYGSYDENGKYSSNIPKITAPDNISFQPYTVTSGNLGNITTDEFGGTQFNLGESQQALQNQLLGGATGFYGNAMQDTAGRETDIYNRMRAAQMPGEEDARLAMEERLFAQGRGGLSTSRVGNPEQFEFQMARERAKNEAMLGAMGQAQQEQMQQAQLGGMFQEQGYAPLAQLMSASSAGAANASMADVARRQQGEYNLEAQLANLQAEMGSRTGLADLYSGLFTGATGALGAAGSSIFDAIFNRG
jgi:hypothetical protein